MADHANILSADTEEYIYAISSQLSDACGAQIGVYTVEEALEQHDDGRLCLQRLYGLGAWLG